MDADAHGNAPVEHYRCPHCLKLLGATKHIYIKYPTQKDLDLHYTLDELEREFGTQEHSSFYEDDWDYLYLKYLNSTSFEDFQTRFYKMKHNQVLLLLFRTFFEPEVVGKIVLHIYNRLKSQYNGFPAEPDPEPEPPTHIFRKATTYDLKKIYNWFWFKAIDIPNMLRSFIEMWKESGERTDSTLEEFRIHFFKMNHVCSKMLLFRSHYDPHSVDSIINDFYQNVKDYVIEEHLMDLSGL
jgi:hypothetical protein